MTVRTWWFETAAVAAALLPAVLLSDKGGVEWVGAAAVLCTFGHASVANRMAEQIAHHETMTGQRVVTCYQWELRYWLLKEALWLAYFLVLGAYAALVGVGLFLAYPIWRRWWRKRHPYKPEEPSPT